MEKLSDSVIQQRLEELMVEKNPTDDDLTLDERKTVNELENTMNNRNGQVGGGLTKEDIKRKAANTAIMLYNATMAEIYPITPEGEVKNVRIPILDTIYRKLYYTYLVEESQRMSFDDSVYTAKNGYIPLIQKQETQVYVGEETTNPMNATQTSKGGKKRRTKKGYKKSFRYSRRH